MSKNLHRILYSSATLLMLAPMIGSITQPITASAKRRSARYSRRVRRPRRHMYRRAKARRGYRRSARANRRRAHARFTRAHRALRHTRAENLENLELSALETPQNKLSRQQKASLVALVNSTEPHHSKRQKRTIRRVSKGVSVRRMNAQINRAFQANETLGRNTKGLHRAVFHYYHVHHVSFTTAINHVLARQNISYLNKQTKAFNAELNGINNDLHKGHYSKAIKKSARVHVNSHKAQALIAHHANSHKVYLSLAKPARAKRHAAVKRVLFRKSASLKRAERRLSSKDQRQLGKLIASGVFNNHSKRTDQKMLNSYLNNPQLMYVKPSNVGHKVYTLKATNTTTGNPYTVASTNKQQLQHAYNDANVAGLAKQGRVHVATKAAQPIMASSSQINPTQVTSPQELANDSSLSHKVNLANQEVNILNHDGNLSNFDKEILLSDEQMLGQELARDGVQIQSVNPNVLSSLSAH